MAIQKNQNINIQSHTNEFLLYKSESGEIKVDVLLRDENIWMSQKKIAELFGVQRPAITKHLNNIFETNELDKKVVCSILELPTQHGAIKGKIQNVKTKFYNLDAIIAVGYRVNSKRATQFRIWSNKIIKQFIIKGYVMDVERLKNPQPAFGKDYFDEQLAIIRDIRSSERRFYQKITDIYAQCSIDYDKGADETKKFFAHVQNKLHYGVHGRTAAELITQRADSKEEHMGLTTWKNAPKGPVRKTDVIVAKNYLNQKELEALNRIVTMYLDYAEDQAEKGISMTMKDWIQKLDAFLQFNGREVLEDFGSVSAQIAHNLAESEFEKYHKKQSVIYQSDFDRMVKKLEK